MNKLRLLLFEECNRKCVGCCNNDWDLASLSICHSFCGYDQILLTGGEPLLKPELVIETITKIRTTSTALIYVYTAKVDKIAPALGILVYSDGMCVTLHEQSDVPLWMRFALTIPADLRQSRSLRLNVFKGIDIQVDNLDMSCWKVKDNIQWIRNCPLPTGETLMRLLPSKQ